jgi:AcrR family transcriptional regulator
LNRIRRRASIAAVTPPARARLPLDERRAQLLERGRELFNSRAYDEISIDDIAAAAGISKGLLYHYFPSKRDFYVATIREAARELLAVTQPVGEDPRAQLRTSLAAYLEYVRRNARTYSGLLRSGVGTDPEVGAVVDETREAMIERVAQGVGLASPRGTVRLALRGWVGMVEAASLEWVERRALGLDAVLRLLAHALRDVLEFAARADAEAATAPAGKGEGKPAGAARPRRSTGSRRRSPR